MESEQPLVADRWTHLTMTYDGSRRASGIRLYADGQPVTLATNLDFLNQTFSSK
jgi:hypothetical protein